MRIKKVMKVSLIVGVLLGVAVMAADHLSSSAKYGKGDIRMKGIEQSLHYNNGKFRNAEAWKFPSFGEYASLFRELLFSGNERSPKRPLPVRDVNLEHFADMKGDGLNVTWLGHSSLMINIDGYKILTDPVFEKRITLFGPSRFNGDVPLDLNRLPGIDVVIVSHNHYDHLNKFSIRFLTEKTGRFIVPLGVGAELEGWGVPREKIVELDWWDEYRVNENLEIAATPARHFSGRGLSDRDETLWASWVIRGPGHKVFFSGDSGYFDGFKDIGDKYGPFDMTFMECGAYNERWHSVHMFPEETVRAHLDLMGNVLHPIHWGTFNLSLHSWYEPMKRLTDAAESLNVVTATPVAGETTIYNVHIPSEKWWEPLMANKRQEITNKRRLKWHKKKGTAAAFQISKAGSRS